MLGTGMLIPTDTLLMFLVAALAISLVPGPDMLFSPAQGTRAGIAEARR